jgi:hypothetical protein
MLSATIGKAIFLELRKNRNELKENHNEWFFE